MAPKEEAVTQELSRVHMPDSRDGKTYAFRLAQTVTDEKGREKHEIVKFYFTINRMPDGRPGEVFIKADQQGSFLSGVLDVLGIMISLALQHGVPIKVIVEKMKGTRFPPASFTGSQLVSNCTSPLDLLARLFEAEFPELTKEKDGAVQEVVERADTQPGK